MILFIWRNFWKSIQGICYSVNKRRNVNLSRSSWSSYLRLVLNWGFLQQWLYCSFFNFLICIVSIVNQIAMIVSGGQRRNSVIQIHVFNGHFYFTHWTSIYWVFVNNRSEFQFSTRDRQLIRQKRSLLYKDSKYREKSASSEFISNRDPTLLFGSFIFKDGTKKQWKFILLNITNVRL